MRKPLWMIWGMAAILIIGGELRPAQGQTGTQAITTNKDKCLTIAVQGQIAPSEPGDYDIQTTCPETVEALGLKKLRLGDVVAIENHYDYYGRGRYEGAVTIGVVIHGWSDYAGHGPGVNPVLSALPGKIKTRIEPDANTAYYLGIREKPER